MPTGYTHSIKEGMTFNEFIMNCARAFGACVTMRDSSSDTPIPEEFEVSPHYTDKLKEAEKRLKKFKKITIKEAQIKVKKEYDNEVKEYKQRLKEKQELKLKYEDMLHNIYIWRPPSSDHIGLKDFMKEQIKSSIKWDCDIVYTVNNRPNPITVEEWLAKEKKSILRDIEYYSEERDEEIKRISGRNLWVKQLRESLES